MVSKIGPHAFLWVQVGELRQKRGHKKPQHEAGAVFVPRTGLEPARPKAQPPEDCASTNFATWVNVGVKGRESLGKKQCQETVLGQTKSVLGTLVSAMAS